MEMMDDFGNFKKTNTCDVFLMLQGVFDISQRRNIRKS